MAHTIMVFVPSGLLLVMSPFLAGQGPVFSAPPDAVNKMRIAYYVLPDALFTATLFAADFKFATAFNLPLHSICHCFSAFTSRHSGHDIHLRLFRLRYSAHALLIILITGLSVFRVQKPRQIFTVFFVISCSVCFLLPAYSSGVIFRENIPEKYSGLIFTQSVTIVMLFYYLRCHYSVVVL